MKKSINQWAFPSGMSLVDCFKLAKTAGFEGVEVVFSEDGEINLNSTKEKIEKIKEDAKNVGIEIASLATGLFWKYSLTSDNPQEQEKAKDITKKMLEVASWLGTDAILVVPGVVNDVVSYDKAYERSLKALKELSKSAEEYRVCIAVENVWNRFLLSPLEMKQFVDEIGSPFVSVYFDIGNVVLFGYPEQWIRILGKRIKRIHVKDFKRSIGTALGFVNLGYGDINWENVISALKDIGYDGWLIAEYFSGPSFAPEHLIYEISKAMDLILKIKK